MKLPSIDEIKKYFPNISENVLKNTLAVSEGIFTSRTPNLNIVKDKMSHVLGTGTKTKPESHYKFLTRYFLTSAVEKVHLIQGLLCLSCCLLNQKHKASYLTLAGTSWELGSQTIHLLTLCVVINGVSVPIWWEDLAKKGGEFSRRTDKFYD